MSNPIIVHDQPAAKTYSPAEGSPQSGCASRDAAPPVTPKRETITIERKDWLELPRNITLKRFVNTSRETHFIGQYRDDKNPGNPNPRRVYTLDVVPIGTEALAAVDLPPVWEVGAHEDGKPLFKIVTKRGRAVAEYLGVKALKAWLNYCVSKRQRRGKQSRKNHHKRYRANLRARKAAKLAAEKEVA